MDRNFLYRKMYALIKELHLEKAKPGLLSGYGVEHTSELEDADLQDLVNRLDQMKHDKIFAAQAQEDVKHWRSTLLTLLNRYGVYSSPEDWSHINHFLLDKRVAGKLIYQMSIDELKATCVRMRAILRDQTQRIEKVERLATMN